MNILNTILDTIFPVNCIACGKNGKILCLRCLSLFPQAERASAEWVFPLYDYRHPPLKKAIWLLKYKGKRRLGKTFAEILYGRILEELGDKHRFCNFQDPILIPIPLARKRKVERGFNQAEILTREIINLDKGLTFTLETDILIKPKDSIHQAKIENRNKRIENIKGTFSVKKRELIKNRNLILIDDVTTTGATLNEARKTLQQAGAKKIIAFTIAH